MTATLAVDVSNLQTGLALWHADDAPHHWTIASTPGSTADEYRVLLVRLLLSAGLEPTAVTDCVLGCVVPELAATFQAALLQLLGTPPLLVEPGVRTGMDIRTDDPRDVGADRIANAVAARARCGAPVVVLDFGTALTIDVVGPNGDYLGAVIAPGMEVAAEGLSRRAARLRRIELRAPPRAIAHSTAHGLQSGLVFGTIGMIEGLLRRVHDEIGPAPVMATGEAPSVAQVLALTDAVQHYDPLLTLDGLRLIHAHHTQRA